MKKNIYILLLLLFTIFGGILRFYNNTKNPVSLNIDEVSFGYSAYSILKTGHDETGAFMPLSFRSTGDYKNPVLIYSLVPTIALFGLNEFSVRFTTALIGTVSIPAIFLLLYSLIKDKKIALIGSFFLTISPWHIYYSRFASDHLIGLFFIIIGIYFAQKMLEGKKRWSFLAAIALVLSMYTYHSQRLFVPLLMISLLFLNKKTVKSNSQNMVIFILTCVVLAIPLVYLSIFGSASSRAGMVILSQDIDYTRYVILDHLHRSIVLPSIIDFLLKPITIFSHENLLLFTFWIKRYLNYFQPDFLFFNGLSMTTPGTLGLGVLYLFELPWLILGIYEFIKVKIKNKGVVIAWVLLGILPSSLTNNEQSSGRSLIILPMLLLIISFGLLRFFNLINKIKSSYLRFGLIGGYAAFIGIILVQSFLIFAIHFPMQRGEAFMEGTKETILYAQDNRGKYKEIVFDPYRGIEAPYIVNVVHMYILFYTMRDPATYQKEAKIHKEDLFSFDKFTIRRIDWRADKDKKDILFIGSPWSLPEKDIKESEILQRIYLSNGDQALLIVSPKRLRSD